MIYSLAYHAIAFLGMITALKLVPDLIIEKYFSIIWFTNRIITMDEFKKYTFNKQFLKVLQIIAVSINVKPLSSYKVIIILLVSLAEEVYEWLYDSRILKLSIFGIYMTVNYSSTFLESLSTQISSIFNTAILSSDLNMTRRFIYTILHAGVSLGLSGAIIYFLLSYFLDVNFLLYFTSVRGQQIKKAHVLPNISNVLFLYVQRQTFTQVILHPILARFFDEMVDHVYIYGALFIIKVAIFYDFLNNLRSNIMIYGGFSESYKKLVESGAVIQGYPANVKIGQEILYQFLKKSLLTLLFSLLFLDFLQILQNTIPLIGHSYVSLLFVSSSFMKILSENTKSE